jgi:hypothetical protein
MHKDNVLEWHTRIWYSKCGVAVQNLNSRDVGEEGEISEGGCENRVGLLRLNDEMLGLVDGVDWSQL